MAAKEYGADFIGFVFAPSRRRIEVDQAALIAAQVPDIGKVGVFVNQPLAEVKEIAEKCCLSYVQLHGEESPEYCCQVGVPVIKGVSVGDGFDAGEVNRYQVEYVLLDTYMAGQSGGTGASFDWQKAKEVIGDIKRPFFVAGGLNSGNVQEAIRLLHPEGVDVSGGVETQGEKDVEKIRLFIETVKHG